MPHDLSHLRLTYYGYAKLARDRADCGEYKFVVVSIIETPDFATKVILDRPL